MFVAHQQVPRIEWMGNMCNQDQDTKLINLPFDLAKLIPLRLLLLLYQYRPLSRSQLYPNQFGRWSRHDAIRFNELL